DVRVAVRTGDTAASERAAMLRRPPHCLITTPESMYLLVTAERSRAMLGGVRTVIVDEIHAVAGNKRGSHLALTLERLAHLVQGPPQRIGLSATQRPIEAVARLLVGAGADRSNPDGSPRCSIVDIGHQRDLDLVLELPDDELGAVASAEQMGEILDRIADHAKGPRTTLVFVNSRRASTALPHRLRDRRAREGPPDNPRLREHPADVRARRPPVGRAPRRRPGGRPSREPIEGPAATGGSSPAGRGSPSAGGHGVPGA